MKRTIAVLLLFVFVFSFAACGAEGPQGTYIASYGEYVKYKIVFDGDKVYSYGVCNADGSYDAPSEGTFTMDGNTVLAEYSKGTNDTFVWDPEADTLSYAEGLLTFHKQ